jgi:DNA-binding MltR family transcriptional regulator
MRIKMSNNEIDKDIDEAVKNLEKNLQIKNGFFDSLYQEDDWSFIIKAHAIIEASISSLLTEYFGKEKLIDIFSRIELSNKSYGKIIFIKDLNLLYKEERRFISSLSEIRNKLVHNIKEIDFSIKAFVDSLNKDKKRIFINSFGYCYLPVKNG